VNLLRKTRERLNERGMELLWDFEERQGIMTNEKKKKKTERKIRLTGKQKRNIQREKHRYNLKNIL
jgi:hypothetical protein